MQIAIDVCNAEGSGACQRVRWPDLLAEMSLNPPEIYLCKTLETRDWYGRPSVICNPVVQIAALKQPVYCAQFPAIFQG
jgi:hypothetical protein